MRFELCHLLQISLSPLTAGLLMFSSRHLESKMNWLVLLFDRIWKVYWTCYNIFQHQEKVPHWHTRTLCLKRVMGPFVFNLSRFLKPTNNTNLLSAPSKATFLAGLKQKSVWLRKIKWNTACFHLFRPPKFLINQSTTNLLGCVVWSAECASCLYTVLQSLPRIFNFLTKDLHLPQTLVALPDYSATILYISTLCAYSWKQPLSIPICRSCRGSCSL